MSDLYCPKGHGPEIHPKDENKALIRAFKVFDEKGAWSQCLVCSGYYDSKLNPTPEKHSDRKGWFVS
jgi:hypothetical protein